MTAADLTKLINHKVSPVQKLVAIENAFFDASLRCVAEFENTGSQSVLRTGAVAARVSCLAMRDSIRYHSGSSTKKV